MWLVHVLDVVLVLQRKGENSAKQTQCKTVCKFWAQQVAPHFFIAYCLGYDVFISKWSQLHPKENS